MAYVDELYGVYGYSSDEYAGVEGVVRRGARRALLGGGHELGEFPLGLLYVLETALLAFTMWGFGIILGYLKGSPMIGQIIAGLVLGPGVLNIVPNFMIPGKDASETGIAPPPTTTFSHPTPHPAPRTRADTGSRPCSSICISLLSLNSTDSTNAPLAPFRISP